MYNLYMLPKGLHALRAPISLSCKNGNDERYDSGVPSNTQVSGVGRLNGTPLLIEPIEDLDGNVTTASATCPGGTAANRHALQTRTHTSSKLNEQLPFERPYLGERQPLRSQPHPSSSLRHRRSNVRTRALLLMHPRRSNAAQSAVPSAHRPVSLPACVLSRGQATSSALKDGMASTVELPWRTRKARCSLDSSGPGKNGEACRRSAAERTGSAHPCSPGSRPAVPSPAWGWAPLEGWRPRAWTGTAGSRESWAALPACWQACTSS